MSDHWQEKDNTYNVLLEISFSDTVNRLKFILTLYMSNDNQNLPNIHNVILEHILQCEYQAVGCDQKKVLE